MSAWVLASAMVLSTIVWRTSVWMPAMLGVPGLVRRKLALHSEVLVVVFWSTLGSSE